MDYSARIRKEAKHYGVKPDWLVMADLRSVGYSDAEAYSIVHQESFALSAGNETALRDRIVKTTEFKNLVSDRAKLLKESKVQVMGDDKDIELISKEQVAKELLKSAFMQPAGSKERGDFLMKYDDITRKNQEIDTKNDDDGGVGIYLPEKCYQCVLLEAYIEKQKKLEKQQQSKEKTDKEDNGDADSNLRPEED